MAYRVIFHCKMSEHNTTIKCEQKGCDGDMLLNNESFIKYNWAVGYTCESCNSVKVRCNICTSINGVYNTKRKNLIHVQRLSRHHKENHADCYCEDVKPKKKAKITEVKKDNNERTAPRQTTKAVINIEDVCEPVNSYDRSASYEYFKRNADAESKNQGATFIIGLAISHTTSGYKRLNDDDIILHLLLSRFISNLTRNQRIELGFILELIKKKYTGECNGSSYCGTNNMDTKVNSDINTISTRIPSSESEFARIYLRGPYSVLQNIPHPDVTIVQGHSYVSVKQCLSNFLSLGHYPAVISKHKTKHVRNISESKMAMEVMQRALRANPTVLSDDLVVVLGTQWSDDFEPNSSSKSNRGSVWMKTITFISDSNTNNDIVNTYPLSIGLKSSSHDCIEEKFIKECSELCSGKNNIVYCSRKNKNLHVHFEILASLGDQPERRSMNYLMLGNSTYSSRYGYAANVGAISRFLPPCDNCFTGMKNNVHYIQQNIKCIKCVNWNLMSTSSLLSYDPPKYYPSEKIMKLRPIELTFDILKKCIDKASNMMMAGDWSEANVMAYCSANGINNEGYQKISQRSKNMKALQYYNSSDIDEKDIEDGECVMKDCVLNKDKYTQWRGGPFWNSSLNLNQFIDALMHLLFLGITKSTKKLLYNWITTSRRANKFNVTKKDLFSPVTAMGLEWCKVLDMESGWVSDNYLAFARLIKWFYHPLIVLQPDEPFIEPTASVNVWKVKTCKKWLSMRGLSIKGKVSELRQQIIDYKNDDNIIHDIGTSVNCSLENINNCIGSLLSMVAIIMSREVDVDTTPNEVDREVRIFMTHIHKVDLSMVKNESRETTKHQPFWVRKYNYQSLFNLPKCMQLYGPLINLWEGANKGEGYLRFGKPMITDIHSINWQVNAHCKLLRGNAFDSVVNSHIIHNSTKSVHERYIEHIDMRENRKKKMYFSYSTVRELYSVFKRHRPLSCIRTSNDCYYAIVKGNSRNTIQGYPIYFKYSNRIESLNMVFHTVQMNEQSTDKQLVKLDESMFTKYMLLLPKLGEFGYTNNQSPLLYYVIDSEWNELDEEYQFNRPKSPGCKY